MTDAPGRNVRGFLLCGFCTVFRELLGSFVWNDHGTIRVEVMDMYNSYNGVYNPLQNVTQNNPYPYVQSMRQTPMELVRVTGLQGAQAYQMPPNSTVALFDGGADLMYIKTTDGAGFATVRTFEFKPKEDPAPVIAQEYATKADLNALREELLSIGKQPVRKQTKPDAAE